MTDVQPIGPECFASADGWVICWKGQNYIRTFAPESESLPLWNVPEEATFGTLPPPPGKTPAEAAREVAERLRRSAYIAESAESQRLYEIASAFDDFAELLEGPPAGER